MKTKNIYLWLAVAVVGLSCVAQVGAQPYVMGFSGGDPNSLVVGTSGGPITLTTAQDLIGTKLNQGWWSATYANNPGNDNHIIGSPDGGTDWLNDYFIFDLDNLAGAAATSATLVLNDPAGIGDDGTPPFNMSFWDVTTPAAILNNTTGTSAAIYNDLGSGVEYGSLLYPGGTVITVTLDQAALNAINSQGAGYFAIGGTLTPSVPDGGTTLGLLGMCVSALFGLKRKL